jgi:hypothetical protein
MEERGGFMGLITRICKVLSSRAQRVGFPFKCILAVTVLIVFLIQVKSY